MFQKFAAQGLELIGRQAAEAGFDQPRSTTGHERSEFRLVQRSQLPDKAQTVERSDQIRRGIRKRTVEIETVPLESVRRPSDWTAGVQQVIDRRAAADSDGT